MSAEAVEGKAEFTASERNEIITRLQAVENMGQSIAQSVANLENVLDEVHGFCMRLGVVLDGLGSNPLLAAMMPPDVAESMMQQ